MRSLSCFVAASSGALLCLDDKRGSQALLSDLFDFFPLACTERAWQRIGDVAVLPQDVRRVRLHSCAAPATYQSARTRSLQPLHCHLTLTGSAVGKALITQLQLLALAGPLSAAAAPSLQCRRLGPRCSLSGWSGCEPSPGTFIITPHTNMYSLHPMDGMGASD